MSSKVPITKYDYAINGTCQVSHCNNLGSEDSSNSESEFDVIIIGAGISGICAAYYLQQLDHDLQQQRGHEEAEKKTESNKKNKLSYCILERRSQLGGTWDLFRYPGIRSDSDMYTFGFPFRPWQSAQHFGEGADILKYMKDTVEEFHMDKHIVYEQTVRNAKWCDKEEKWTLDVEFGIDEEDQREGLPKSTNSSMSSRNIHKNNRIIKSSFLFLCTGYYSYENPHWPTFPGQEKFQGNIIHPQFWPSTETGKNSEKTAGNYKGQNVVIIGSGATAVTLAPNMAAGGAKSVTVLQRSPTFMVSLPSRSLIFTLFSKILFFWMPWYFFNILVRWVHIFLHWFSYNLVRKFPNFYKKKLLELVEKQLGPEREHFMQHFTPVYHPWDQRICAMPDGDYINSVRSGKVKMVSGKIRQITKNGIEVESLKGEHEDGKSSTMSQFLPADLIIPATGLNIQFRGNINMMINNEKILTAKDFFTYRGAMSADVPNFFAFSGYLNASWTLKACLIAQYACRVLHHMKQHQLKVVTPRAPPDIRSQPGESVVQAFNATYLTRGQEEFPVQGKKSPWRTYQNYFLDFAILKLFSSVTDSYLQYK